jgi:hypothetical protein
MNLAQRCRAQYLRPTGPERPSDAIHLMSEAILFLPLRIADAVGSDQDLSFPEAGLSLPLA